MVVRVGTEDINSIGRLTTGRKAVKLTELDDVVIGFPVSRTQKNKYIVVGTKEGKIVKVNINEIVKGELNRKGQRLLKLAATDIVINGMICDDDDNLLIIGTKHSKAINVSEITQTARDSAGRNVVKDEEIKNMVKI